MSQNATFVQALADATGRRIDVSAVTEATAMGAAYLAGVATGIWTDLATASAQAKPARSVEPRRRLNRERWLDARARSERTVPELSSLDF
jgi:glycerol kinase